MPDEKKVDNATNDVDMSKIEAQIQLMLNTANQNIEDMVKNASEEASNIIKDASKEAAKIIKNAKNSVNTGETENQVVFAGSARVVRKEPMVKVKLKKDKEKNNADLPVSINGKTYLLQRGVWVEVPLAVKEVLDNSERQEEYAIAYSEGLSDAFAEKLKQL